MNISAAGLALVKRSEGFRHQVYLDVNGFPTIGYGHRLQHPNAFPDGITEAGASELLMADLHQAEQAVSRLVHAPLTQGQFDALVDFCFNLGQGRLAGSTLLADLNAGRTDDAAMQLLLWDHAATRECPALRTRREAEFALWFGREPASQSAA